MRVTTDLMNKILFARLVEGKGTQEAAMALGTSSSTVSAVTRSFLDLRDGKYDELARRLPTDASATRPIVEYCAARLGKPLPAEVDDALNVRAAKIRERLGSGKHPEPPKPEPAAPTIDDKVSTNANNEKVFFCRLLEEITRLNNGLEDLISVVIPKYTGDLKECINTNTDLITQRLAACEKRLEKIEYQTRKRGM